jgi:hypothetical protein
MSRTPATSIGMHQGGPRMRHARTAIASLLLAVVVSAPAAMTAASSAVVTPDAATFARWLERHRAIEYGPRLTAIDHPEHMAEWLARHREIEYGR